MLARLSYTDFNGDNFLANIKGSKNLNNIDINKFAPNIAEGISKLKDWSKSL